jgi:hypothetical protein
MAKKANDKEIQDYLNQSRTSPRLPIEKKCLYCHAEHTRQFSDICWKCEEATREDYNNVYR